MSSEIKQDSKEKEKSSTNQSPEKLEIEEQEKNKEEIQKELTNDEALDLQIEYLRSSTKNILGSIIQDEPDPMSIKYENEIENKKIEKGILLYLQNVHNKHYCYEINYILNSINNKISYINEKNKEFLQNKKFIEREVNAISQEKIDYFNEKETLDKELELLTLNARQNSIICKTDKGDTSLSMNLSTNYINSSEIEDVEISSRKKKLESLKKKYNKLFDRISENKKDYPQLKNKNNMIQGENMILNEKLKQKQLIWDQIRKENERVKTVVIKRNYIHAEPENNQKKEEKTKDKKGQNKIIKVSKMSSFLNNMFKKKK